MNTRDYLHALTAELRVHGVDTWRVEHGGVHPRLVFVWQGRQRFVVFPASPSDSRGPHNAVAGLRRVLGVKRVMVKSSQPRSQHKPHGDRTPAALSITIRPEPWLNLAALIGR